MIRDPLSHCLAIAAPGFAGVGEAVRTAALPAGNVGTAQLRANAVTSETIRSGSVTESDIKNGRIRAGDLAPGMIPPGAAFVIHRVTKDVTTVGEQQHLIPCDDGQVPIGGGGGFLSTTTDCLGNELYRSLVDSAPANGTNAVDDQGKASGWVITARNSSGTKRVAGYVICAHTPAATTPGGSLPQPPSKEGHPRRHRVAGLVQVVVRNPGLASPVARECSVDDRPAASGGEA
jgi:hypothetical protein